MRRRHQRRRKQNQDNTTLARLFFGGLGFLWLASRSLQPEAPQPQNVGPPKEAVDKIAAAQEESMWCWAASIQTVSVIAT